MARCVWSLEFLIFLNATKQYLVPYARHTRTFTRWEPLLAPILHVRKQNGARLVGSRLRTVALNGRLLKLAQLGAQRSPSSGRPWTCINSSLFFYPAHLPLGTPDGR